MLHFIQTSGPYGLLILLLALINLILVIYRASQLVKGVAPPGVESRLNSILFWGGVCAVLGLLGQATGMYNGLSAISRAREIAPSVVFQGLAESFTTTLMGFGVLVLSAVAWLALRTWHRRMAAIDIQP